MATLATLVAPLMAGATTAGAVEVEPGVDWTTIVRERPAERINVLSVDPTRVRAVLSNERIAGRERVSRMGRRVGAVAGVNGSFFSASGDPVGALAIDGQLMSEPVNGRSALILPSPTADPVASASPLIARVRFSGRMYVNGHSRAIDGVDRPRGLIPGCGGRGGDVPTMRPNPVLTCTDSSELVLLSPRYGARPPAEGGVEAIVRDGVVKRLRPPGTGGVPRHGVLLTGTGDAARFLRDAALPGSHARIALTLTAAGHRMALAPGTLAPPEGAPAGGGPAAAAPRVVTGAGPRILRARRIAVAAKAEGFAPPRAPYFFRNFVASRQARTLAGVRPDGVLLLVTVDGRAPGWSAGMTLSEAARLMRSLGARDAMNLGGGGSSTMTVLGEVVNRPSDRVGERPVSNGLFAMP